jgi:hypothetical protein
MHLTQHGGSDGTMLPGNTRAARLQRPDLPSIAETIFLSGQFLFGTVVRRLVDALERSEMFSIESSIAELYACI